MTDKLTNDEIVERLNAGEYTLEEMALLAAKIKNEMALLNADDRAPDDRITITEFQNEETADETELVYTAVCYKPAPECGQEMPTWIEFYWAEDMTHAREQCENANPGCEILAVRYVVNVAITENGGS